MPNEGSYISSRRTSMGVKVLPPLDCGWRIKMKKNLRNPAGGRKLYENYVCMYVLAITWFHNGGGSTRLDWQLQTRS